MTRSVGYQLRLVSDKVLTEEKRSHIVAPSHGGDMEQFIRYMRVLKLADATIQKRIELIERLRTFLGDVSLIDATPAQLEEFQAQFAHLAPASIHVYTRHITAFYRWARRTGLIEYDPAVDLELPRLRKAVPHPTSREEMQAIFACATGRLRTAYILARFAGLRAGEICRMHRHDIDLDGHPTAIIHGKGGKERRIPLLPPVVNEVAYRRGWVVTTDLGAPVLPVRLSLESTEFLRRLGMPTTLHSMRAAFATSAVRTTHDPLLVRDLLGHDSVKTTEIYMDSSLVGAHDRLAALTAEAGQLLQPARLVAVGA